MNNTFFNEIKKNFGFGCMRLPMQGDKVDMEQFREMVDTFMGNGFNYFDTAHVYVGGQSETAIREAISRRYPRESFILTNKLSTHCFTSQEEIRPLFQEQLEACGVDYFDFYLMHAQDGAIYEKFRRCNAYETALELKSEGKIRHFGISFHDKADVLERILTDYPQIEAVQIQFNYVDYEDASVEGRKVYEVCEKFGKPVIVMEPVKGGSLVNLPEDAQKVFDDLHSGMSNASYALRFAGSFSNVCMILSGMSNMEQMNDNISFMKDFQPLSNTEMKAVHKVCDIFRSMNMIPCTACHYCTDGCPMKIRIPDLFSCYNLKTRFNNWNQDYYYSVITRETGKASDCIRCGQWRKFVRSICKLQSCSKMWQRNLSIKSLFKNLSSQESRTSFQQISLNPASKILAILSHSKEEDAAYR